MGVSLSRPAEGAVGWSGSIDGNWSTLEGQYVARQKSDTGIVTITGTTEQLLMANTTIPANSLAAGVSLRVYAAGSIAIPATSTPTVTWRLRWGGISGPILATVSWAYGSSGSAYNVGWVNDFKIVGVTTGASGTAETDGWATSNGAFFVNFSIGTQTIDTTTDTVLVWTVQSTLGTVSTAQRVMDTDKA